jgi:hypothetical protein
MKGAPSVRAGAGADTPGSAASKGGSDRSRGAGGSRRRSGDRLTPVVEADSSGSRSPQTAGGGSGRGGGGSEYSYASGSRSEYSDSGSGSDSEYTDSEDEYAGARGPARRVIRVMLEGAGPMDLKNAPARLVVAAYEGHEVGRRLSLFAGDYTMRCR